MNEEQMNFNMERFRAIGGCVGCLNRDRKMFCSDKINKCLRMLADIHIPEGVIIKVCWECNAYINNIFRFKRTVERSHNILVDYSIKLNDFGGLPDAFPSAQNRLQTVSRQLVDINELYMMPLKEKTVKTEMNSDFDTELGSTEENTFGEISESYYQIKPATDKEHPKYYEVPLIGQRSQSLKVESISNPLQDPLLGYINSSEIKSEKLCDESGNKLFGKSITFNHMDTNIGEITYCCKVCSYKCNKEKDLDDHEKTHTQEKLINSGISSDKFMSKSSKKSHLPMEEKQFTCNICSNKFKQRNSLKVHMKIHTGEKPFACDVCPYRSINKGHLNIHMKIHTGEKQFACDICSYRFSQKGSLKLHMKRHIGEKPFACDICPYKCILKRYLDIHIKKHTGEKPFACDICSCKFARKRYLTLHMHKHKGEMPFSCNVCPYKCLSNTSLKTHMFKHTGEKLFVCDICSFRCISKGNLKVHMKRHSVEKPFSCDICPYKCFSKGHLNAHMMKHTGEKPFACDVCSYRCNQRGSLKLHMIKHTGEKPFACDFCPYKCTRRHLLRKHILKHGGENLCSSNV